MVMLLFPSTGSSGPCIHIIRWSTNLKSWDMRHSCLIIRLGNPSKKLHRNWANLLTSMIQGNSQLFWSVTVLEEELRWNASMQALKASSQLHRRSTGATWLPGFAICQSQAECWLIWHNRGKEKLPCCSCASPLRFMGVLMAECGPAKWYTRKRMKIFTWITRIILVCRWWIHEWENWLFQGWITLWVRRFPFCWSLMELPTLKENWFLKNNLFRVPFVCC